MPICHLPGADLFYVEKGGGEPLVFLNGLGGDHLYWLGQLRAFGKQYRCLAVDHRDAGQSGCATEAYSLADLARDLAGLLRALQAGPAHVVGLSMGGMVAQELALAAPELVQSLVLVNSLGRADDWFRATLNGFELIRRQVASTAAFFDAVLPWWVSPRLFDSGRTTWLRWLLHQNPQGQRLDGFVRQLDAIRRYDVLERLPQLRCPVLILAGEDDAIAPRRYSLELQTRLPHAQAVLVPGVGHALPLEDPGQFNGHLRKFLTEGKSPLRRSA